MLDCHSTYNNEYSKICNVTKVENEDQNHYKKDLLYFTNLSWNIYSDRLKKISNEVYQAGKNEFNLNNTQIITKVLEMNIPQKISLSVTSDKSLHYTFRFGDFVLFIETYLSLESENDTYIEFFKKNDLIFEGHYEIESGLEMVVKTHSKYSGINSCAINNKYIPNLLDACAAE